VDKKILVLTEDSQNCNKLLKLLNTYYKTNSYNNGLQGLVNAIEWKPDVVIINHSLLDVNSIELCRQIHQQLKTIIIIIGESLNEHEIIHYYNAGACDVYLGPISNLVLLCKIKVLLNIPRPNKLEDEQCQYGKLVMYKKNYKIIFRSKELKFTKKEFSILWNLLKKHDSVVTREELVKYVWKYGNIEDDRFIDTHLNRIRKKLKQYNINFTIKTVWGIGYKLNFEEVDNLKLKMIAD
jgi:DNA-binding response OmpR family regulator